MEYRVGFTASNLAFHYGDIAQHTRQPSPVSTHFPPAGIKFRRKCLFDTIDTMYPSRPVPQQRNEVGSVDHAKDVVEAKVVVLGDTGVGKTCLVFRCLIFDCVHSF